MKAIIEQLKVIDKKLWILLGVVIFVFIFGMLISKLIYSVGNSNKSYAEVEAIMKEAAIKYYADSENKAVLPEEGEDVSVGDRVLSEGGYMKPLDKLIKKGTCTGKVTVTKEGINYIYASYLDCGKDYKTIEFYNKLIENVVEAGDGLYTDTNGYAFRGENPNNYISIDDDLWRIVSIRDDNTIELVSTTSVDMIIWDNRYNSSEKFQTGYNDFNKSRLKESLQTILEENTTKSHKAAIVPNSIKNILIPVNNCADKYGEKATDFSKCNIRNDLNLSIISIPEYMKASLDSNCKTPGSKECMNYNYLTTKTEYLTLTGNADNSYQIYVIRNSGAIKADEANGYSDIYPVVRIPDSVMYVSGEGTKTKPYVIR